MQIIISVYTLMTCVSPMTQQSADELWKSVGLDFERASEVFAGLTLEVEDDRHDYGEQRILCVGFLEGRMVMVGYVPRGMCTPRIFDEEMQ